MDHVLSVGKTILILINQKTHISMKNIHYYLITRNDDVYILLHIIKIVFQYTFFDIH